MPDSRFFPAPEPNTAEDLANRFGLTLAGTGSAVVKAVAPLHLAGENDLAFLGGKAHLEAAQSSAASVLIVPEPLADYLGGRSLLISSSPHRSFAEIARALYPDQTPAGLSEAASIDPTADVTGAAGIAPGAVVGAGVILGAGTVIESGAVIGSGVVVGADCRIGANAVLSHAILGDRVRILAGAVIGQDGFGYVPGAAGLERIPQLGRVMIAEDVDIGANTTIDRGAGDDTVIGPGTKIDNQVMIGHNCRIGAHCVIVSQVGISGSVTVGDGAQLGGKVGIADHLSIGAGAKVAAGSGVTRDVAPGQTVGGYPAVPVREWHRQVVALARLVSRKKS